MAIQYFVPVSSIFKIYIPPAEARNAHLPVEYGDKRRAGYFGFLSNNYNNCAV